MTYQLIETKTLGTAAASIEFTSIPQDGTDLYVVASLRGDRATNASTLYITINGSTANFTMRRLSGNGSTAGSDAYSLAVMGYGPTNTATSNTFGNASFYLPNYSGSTNKSISVDSVTEDNQTQAFQSIVAALWSNTAAITSMSFYLDVSNLVAGSTISIYKITKGTLAGVVVS